MRTEINTNIDVINNRISTACAANNRNVQDITLVAVSKRKNNELIKFALDYGVKNFGENYAQEMKEKSETINSDKIVWHFIGPIQTNKIKVIAKKGKFFKFSKGWINKNHVKLISYKDKDPFKRINIFKNIKYKWGWKSFKGIDCSALVQIFLNFNNKFCPRDAKDQVKYFKKNIKLKDIKKNDFIYWKGHVAVALSNKKLIHAYGPKKKTVVMEINKTISLIKRSANLSVLSIKRI